MATRPWTTDDDQTLRDLHAAGNTLHGIAKTMTRSKATISGKAAKLGLSWSRERTAAAAHAVHADNKARRVAIVARVYAEAEDVLAGVETGRRGEGWRTILKGSFGVEETKTLEFVPSRDRRDVSDTLSRLLTTAAKLEAVDAGDGADTERSLLAQLGQALGVTGPGT